jgi:hypothetical protein
VWLDDVCMLVVVSALQQPSTCSCGLCSRSHWHCDVWGAQGPGQLSQMTMKCLSRPVGSKLTQPPMAALEKIMGVMRHTRNDNSFCLHCSCCRRSWDVAPSPTPLADDPYDMSAVARQKRVRSGRWAGTAARAAGAVGETGPSLLMVLCMLL